MTRKPIQFMFGDGHVDHPTVIHRKTLDEPPHGNGYWIYLGFSRRLRSNPRSGFAHVEHVFTMNRIHQVPPWLVICRIVHQTSPYLTNFPGERFRPRHRPTTRPRETRQIHANGNYHVKRETNAMIRGANPCSTA